MARMVSAQMAQRLVDILKEEENQQASTTETNGSTDNQPKILYGGSEACDAAQRYVAPTLLLNPSSSSRIMNEEIFGPILPICTFSNRKEAISGIQQLHKRTGIPLYLYVFTTQDEVFRTYTNK